MSVPKPHVFAAVRVLSVGLIDHGNTIVMRLKRSDGGEEAILLPLAIGHDLLAQLSTQLEGEAEKPVTK